MIKQLFDRRFFAGKIFEQLKSLGFNVTFINRLLDANSYVKIDIGLVVHAEFEQQSASKEFVKRCEEIHNVLHIKWLQNVSRRTMQVIINEAKEKFKV